MSLELTQALFYCSIMCSLNVLQWSQDHTYHSDSVLVIFMGRTLHVLQLTVES